MMTLRRIQKLIGAGDKDALLDAVLSNGRPLPIEARLRLGEPDSIGAAAAAFALQRALELSPCVEDVTREAMDRLLSEQRPSGEFGNTATTAVAVRALSLLLQAHGLTKAESALVNEALDRAVHALHWALPSVGGETASLGDKDLDRALVLWQLTDCRQLREILRLDAMERELSQKMLASAPRRVLAMAGTLTPTRRAA